MPGPVQILPAAGPISNLPLGLNDMFGIRGGSYADYLATVIQPTVDLIEMMAANNSLEVISFSANSNAPGFHPQAVLPPGESWLVLSAAVNTVNLLATESIILCMAAYSVPPGGLGFFPFRKWDADGSATVGIRQALSGSRDPFFLSAGMALGWHTLQCTTAAQIQATLVACILRCRR